MQLSSEDRASLRKGFDDVFYLDHVSGAKVDNGNGPSSHDIARAKVHAFSLEIFERCVFLEPNSLLVENCDNLFNEAKGKIAPLLVAGKRKLAVHQDYYVIEPSLKLGEFLTDELSRQKKNGYVSFLTTHAGEWAKKRGIQEELHVKDDLALSGVVAQLSVKQGELLQK